MIERNEFEELDGLRAGEAELKKDGVAFAQRVLREWQAAPGSHASSPSPSSSPRLRLARIATTVIAGGLAAAAALTLALLMRGDGTPHPPRATPFVRHPTTVAAPDPVGTLTAQITRQPQAWLDAITAAPQRMNLARMLELIDLPVPDPAQFVDPQASRS